MASYNELIALINAFIKQNGIQAITGQILNGVLRAMVDQIGRGYAIMGTAVPADDPGTPDAPESWFASTPGTYTNFGGFEVADAEFALLSYTPSTGWAKTTLTEGITEVTAGVDNNVGIPYVVAEYQNGGLSFQFYNLKGATGDPAGFGTVNATVDANIGTPSVSVSGSGPDTAKNYTFAFHNLKGETGVTSVVATVDNTTGNPACAVSLVGQELHLDFTGLKGAQGDTGSSVDYPFTIVNNLTTNDATQALSAAMGVELAGQVSQLEAKVDENCTVNSKRFIVYSEQHIPYKISNGETVIVRVVKTAGSSTAVYARITQTTTGQVQLRSLQYCDEIEFTATTDYNYIYFSGANLTNGAIVDIIRKNKLWQTVKDNTDITRFQNPSYPCFVANGTNHKDVGAPNVAIYGENSTSVFPSNFFRCFRSLKLSGFDKTKKYVLSLFRAGYGATHNDYQIRFAEWNGSSRSNEVTFSITASSISVVGGLNKLSATSGTKKMDAVVDYSCVPLYCSCNMSGSENFVVAPECLEKDLADLENEISELQESALTENDLTVSIVSDNIANPDNIRLGEYINSSGGINTNQDWAMIGVPVTPGQVITFGGFYFGRTCYYAFYNGTTLVSFKAITDPNGRQNPKTVTVPENATILYIDIKSSDSPSDPYSGLMINYGSTLLDYDAYKEAITKIDGVDVYGSGTGGGADLSTLIEDLPVSADGSDISTGYAYINSATGAVIVKQ